MVVTGIFGFTITELKMKKKLVEVPYFNPKTKKVMGTVSVAKYEKPGKFVMVLFNGLEKILNKKISFKVLCALLEIMEDGNKIYLNIERKKEIEAKWDIKSTSIGPSIHRLLKAEVLVRIGTGTFMANPEYFMKGTLNKKPALKVEFEGYLADVREEEETKCA